MKKILLIAPDFNNYTEIFSNSIDKCGYNAISLSFSAYDWRTAVCKLFHCSDKKIIDKKKTIFNKRILELYKEINPEFVIVIRGDFMERETLSSITCPKAIWLYDSVSRYPDMMENWELYDLHYVFEESDVLKLKEKNKESVFLPLGYDEQKYYPINTNTKDVDISFVGAMYGNRKKILEKVAYDFKNKNCMFYGVYEFKRNIVRYIKFIMSDKKNSFVNKKISHEKANELYSRTKININILHEQSQSGWNARLNEILGAGAFQLVSYNELIAKKYEGMLDTFRDYDELKNKIEYYIDNEEIRIQYAQKGYEWAKNNETYLNRFKIILNELEICKRSK
mgnify:FL=1|jgi:spore maturation protein CgeB